MKRWLLWGLWPLAAVAAQVLGYWTLGALVDATFGPEATDPHRSHVVVGMAWLAAHGLLSVFAGLGTAWVSLRRAHAVVAGVLVILVALPATLLGTFSLYFLAACLGFV